MKIYALIIALTAVNIAVLIVVLTGAAAGAPDAVPSVVRAQRIELVDEDGRIRARLSTEPGGEVVFRLIGSNGDIRVKLAASDDGSGLVLLDESTELGVHILAERTGTFVKLRGENNRERILEP